jgi:hypothetical protein
VVRRVDENGRHRNQPDGYYGNKHETEAHTPVQGSSPLLA